MRPGPWNNACTDTLCMQHNAKNLVSCAMLWDPVTVSAVSVTVTMKCLSSVTVVMVVQAQTLAGSSIGTITMNCGVTDCEQARQVITV